MEKPVLDPMPMVEARLRVIYGDTDQMGVVYYANYFRYFEFSRSEYLRAKGAAYRQFEHDGVLLPVVDASCTYKASARYDDMLLIRAEVSEVRRASLVFVYEVLREEDGVLLCTGRTVHACVGKDGRPVRMPERLKEILNPAKKEADGDG